jgi:hypothetical protein
MRAGHPLHDRNHSGVSSFRPKCVEALAGMRIVSVAAGYQYTIVVIDTGMAFPFGCREA